MSTLLELAQACEADVVPDRKLELDVWKATGGTCPPGKVPLTWLHCYTSSVSAALDLCAPADAQDVMHEALKRLGARYSLHVRFFPEDLKYANVLARFVTAAALRRKDEIERAAKGTDPDLQYYELSSAELLIAATNYRLALGVPNSEDLSDQPMAHMWDSVVQSLIQNHVLNRHPGRATAEMVEAGRAAYLRKEADDRSPTPTEHPEDGGGPIGYAWRAMAKVHAEQAAKA